MPRPGFARYLAVFGNALDHTAIWPINHGDILAQVISKHNYLTPTYNTSRNLKLWEIASQVSHNHDYPLPAGTVRTMYVQCTYSWYNVRTMYVHCTYSARWELPPAHITSWRIYHWEIKAQVNPTIATPPPPQTHHISWQIHHWVIKT